MSKVIVVGGVPASGKTTLMQAFIGRHEGWSGLKLAPLVDGIFNIGKQVAVIGKYKPYYPLKKNDFEGTDKLSMAVQPAMLKFINTTPDTKCVMEGDRLFTRSFLEGLERPQEVEVIILTASERDLGERHTARGDTQTEGWLASRDTKVARIRDWLEGQTAIRWREETHINPQDTELIVDSMWEGWYG